MSLLQKSSVLIQSGPSISTGGAVTTSLPPESKQQDQANSLRPTSALALSLGIGKIHLPHSGYCEIKEAADVEDFLNRLEFDRPEVLVLGPHLELTTVCAILARAATMAHTPLAIVAGVSDNPERVQEFVDKGCVYYISRGALSSQQIFSIVDAALKQLELYRKAESNGSPSIQKRIEEALEFSIQIASQTDLRSLSILFTETVRRTVGADRATCWLYDAKAATVSSVETDTHAERVESATSGLVAFVARTGFCLEVDHANTDPRYDAEVDNPGGADDDHLLVSPVYGATGTPVAVLTAARSAAFPQFSSEDVALIGFLLECISPPLTSLLLKQRLEHLLLKRPAAVEVFRPEALEYHLNPSESEGNILSTPPPWLRRSHWIMVALLLASFTFLVFAQIKERATGIAVIRARNRIAVVATSGGLVRSVEIAPGVHVRRGDPILRFESGVGGGASDQVHEQLRAPSDGIIGDVRMRAGEQIASGDQVASIVDQDSGYELIVFLPQQYAPQIHRGMKGSFKIEGYTDSHESMTVDDVGSEIVGPREAARFASSADELTVTGPSVVVHCPLTSQVFSVGDRSYEYHDGMTGQAEVDLRSEPMIISILPGVKEFLRNLKESAK